jgi:phosphomannomutase
MTLVDCARFANNFVRITGSPEILLARDTRSTGSTICKAVAGVVLRRGKRLTDFGIISTPALFRESLTRKRPAVMVTASHNEPEYNGLKLIVDGKGIGKEVFDEVAGAELREPEAFGEGEMRKVVRTRYVDDLVKKFGEESCEGVKVALDLGGGSAISHAAPLLRRLGCEVTSVNDSYGVFNRKVDPTVDGLDILRRMVKSKKCDVGLGFDCDGDRLVIVDDKGSKRTGDYMLTLALAQILAESKERNVVVSVDTTQAVDIVAAAAGARVLRSKVGEANVVRMMVEYDASLGGEGSSGGLIDGSFNYCRDSMLAALTIIRALKRKKRRAYEGVNSFYQSRVALQLQRSKALRAIKTLVAKNPGADTTDGVKIWLSKRSWVLVRVSGTEDIVRVSAEAVTAGKATEITHTFSARMKELSR